MITFEHFDDVIEEVYRFNQDHVFEYWEQLNNEEKKSLLVQLSGVDLDLMNRLFLQREGTSLPVIDFEPAEYVKYPETTEDKERYRRARDVGIRYIKNENIAALLVAGGQGTRLGFKGPKGMFPIGPISNKTIFQIFAEKLLHYSEKYNVRIPWIIMTSMENHNETVSFLKENRYFGLNSDDVLFFSQNLIPSLDENGRLILESRNSIFMNPDGHGGSLSALSSSGVLDKMKNRGIETITCFQVDNPLVKIIDPAFIGFHILYDSDVSSKAVKKTDPDEKVGLFVKFANGKTGVVEYSDMTTEKQNQKDDNGELKFCMGNIAIHLFKVTYIEEITSGSDISLPYHTARKKIKAFDHESYKEINGVKFEKFIFDSIPLTQKSIIFETLREEEFAPVKNNRGIDSPDSAREQMSNLHKKWLISRNIELPKEIDIIEISPLIAVEPDDLHENISIQVSKKVYLG